MNDKTMMIRNKFSGLNVLVVGMGKSGKAAATVLNELGANVVCQDSATEDSLDKDFISWMKSKNIKGIFGKAPDDPTSFDMFVLSPGVPTDLDFIKSAKDKGVKVIGELELAYLITDGKFVAITGTNGKTTTTTLVGEIFSESGRHTDVVGNIGNPVVISALEASHKDWLVAEVSSFQLETTDKFRPCVSSILNLTPDHLNRHKTMQAYGEAKAKITTNQTEEDYLVINYDDKECFSLSKYSKANIVPFSRVKKLEYGAWIYDNKIMVNISKNSSPIKICDLNELQIIGDHNVENVLVASAICICSGIDSKVIGNTIKNFKGVEHRIEPCGEIGGVRYFNDSKGTNVDATITAIRALKNNIILIAGGDAKGQKFDELIKEMKGKVKTLILLGRDAKFIEDAAAHHGYNTIISCKDMNECVQRAHEIAVEGDYVLLSPACASWDMYDNYEQRGRDFKNCVAKIKE